MGLSKVFQQRDPRRGCEAPGATSLSLLFPACSRQLDDGPLALGVGSSRNADVKEALAGGRTLKLFKVGHGSGVCSGGNEAGTNF